MPADRVLTLGALVDRLGGPSKAARLFGYNAPSFLSQMLKGDRPVTEKTGRRIEKMIGLPNGWLDEDWPNVEAIRDDLATRITLDQIREYFNDDKVPIGMTFAEYQETLRDARNEEFSNPEDWPEYGRKVPLRYPSGRLISAGPPPGRTELGPISVHYGANNEGKSMPVLAFLRWTETAAARVKEELDAHEELHIPEEKIPLLVQTLADLMRYSKGVIDDSLIRSVIQLAGEMQNKP